MRFLALWRTLLRNKITGVNLLNLGIILLTTGEMNKDSTRPTTGLRFPLQCTQQHKMLTDFSTMLLPELKYFQNGRTTTTLVFYMKHDLRHTDRPG